MISGKRVLVTGGAGFLGRVVCDGLRRKGVAAICVPRRHEYDLVQAEAAARMYEDFKPEVAIHLAAVVGGIGANRSNPGRFFFENMAIGLNVMEQARHYGHLEKLVIVGTTCSYPKLTPTPFREERLWDGYPEETNAPYGIAKRVLLVMMEGYRQQYGLKGVYLIPANLYGPGDNFNPQSSHVIPALVQKLVDAKREGCSSVTVWGTGSATREFLYVNDAAEGILLATEHYEGQGPVNLGSGHEVSIKDLVHIICELVGFTGEILWDRNQPDGQPCRQLDTQKALQAFGFRATTDLKSGLQATIHWYEQQFAQAPIYSAASIS